MEQCTTWFSSLSLFVFASFEQFTYLDCKSHCMTLHRKICTEDFKAAILEAIETRFAPYAYKHGKLPDSVILKDPALVPYKLNPNDIGDESDVVTSQVSSFQLLQRQKKAINLDSLHFSRQRVLWLNSRALLDARAQEAVLKRRAKEEEKQRKKAEKQEAKKKVALALDGEISALEEEIKRIQLIHECLEGKLNECFHCGCAFKTSVGKWSECELCRDAEQDLDGAWFCYTCSEAEIIMQAHKLICSKERLAAHQNLVKKQLPSLNEKLDEKKKSLKILKQKRRTHRAEKKINSYYFTFFFLKINFLIEL